MLNHLNLILVPPPTPCPIDAALNLCCRRPCKRLRVPLLLLDPSVGRIVLDLVQWKFHARNVILLVIDRTNKTNHKARSQRRHRVRDHRQGVALQLLTTHASPLLPLAPTQLPRPNWRNEAPTKTCIH